MEQPAKIYIKDLKIDCILGVSEEERKKKQEVIVNITLTVDAEKAIETDTIQDTINYRNIYEEIITLVQNSQFHLLEALANAIAGYCLEDKRVVSATVSVEKPTVLKKANGVSVEITKKNE